MILTGKKLITANTAPFIQVFRRYQESLSAFGVPFLVTIIVYLYTLAPTVTFEDSGELIAAAYHLGIPHQPGYPLFTILGRIFCHLPFDPVAYRMNLMSAFFGAVASGLISLTVFRLLKEWKPKEPSPNGVAAFGIVFSSIVSGLVFSFAFETWEQSIITEVYSLHHVLLALMLFLLIGWTNAVRNREPLFYLLCYVSGLALTNHYLSIVIFPSVFLFIAMNDRTYLLNPTRGLTGLILVLAGLSLYAYLPLSSLRDPIMDWGNPENNLNFVNTILRQQYQTGEPHTWARWTAQMIHYGKLLWDQWPAFVLIPAVIGLYPLFRAGRIWIVFTLIYFTGTIMLTVYATNFDIRNSNPVIADENKHLVSVFYTGSYLMISLLAGIGLCRFLSWLKSKPVRAIGWALMIILPISIIAVNVSRVNMRQYRFAEHYARNVFSSVPDSALILTNYDPHYFTLFYYQQVEGLHPDLTIIDIKLLRTTWYMDWLNRTYPALMNSVQNEYRPYRALRDQSEKGIKTNAAAELKMHTELVNAMIASRISRSGRVVLTFDPPEGIAPSYFQISTGTSIALFRKPEDIEPVRLEQLYTDDYLDEGIPKDRMARFFMTYYGRLFLARAVVEESLYRRDDALTLYEKSYAFLKADLQFAPMIRDAINRLKKK